MIETTKTDRASRPAIRRGTLRLQIEGQVRGTEPANVR